MNEEESDEISPADAMLEEDVTLENLHKRLRQAEERLSNISFIGEGVSGDPQTGFMYNP